MNLSGFLLALDPGKKGCGVSLFSPARELLAATYVRRPIEAEGLRGAVAMADAAWGWALEFRFGIPGIAAIEVPRSYQAGAQKGPQDDLIDIALVAAVMAGHFTSSNVITYYPRDWKGTVDATVCLQRVLDCLTPVERTRIQLVGRTPLEKVPTSSALDHNTLDAVGIGLTACGRFSTKRVYARE